jgi:8-oxo-dGTP pyrophosphatase MutT (NUDIX family)
MLDARCWIDKRGVISMGKRIAKMLAFRECKRITDEKLVPSAVLVPLFEKDGEYYVLFTKRSGKVEHHKGEISFPGGRVDPDDSDLLHTALREGAEEIGLDPRHVTILGRLDDVFTDTDDTDTSARGSASSHNKDRKA